MRVAGDQTVQRKGTACGVHQKAKSQDCPTEEGHSSLSLSIMLCRWNLLNMDPCQDKTKGKCRDLCALWFSQWQGNGL